MAVVLLAIAVIIDANEQQVVSILRHLARGIFTVDDVVVHGIVVGDAQHTGQGVLVIVTQDTRMLIVRRVDTTCHSLLIAVERGLMFF